MKAPKRTIADHLSFITWMIFCIVITVMMIQIPVSAEAKASKIEERAAKYLRENPDKLHKMMLEVAMAELDNEEIYDDLSPAEKHDFALCFSNYATERFMELPFREFVEGMYVDPDVSIGIGIDAATECAEFMVPQAEIQPSKSFRKRS